MKRMNSKFKKENLWGIGLVVFTLYAIFCAVMSFEKLKRVILEFLEVIPSESYLIVSGICIIIVIVGMFVIAYRDIIQQDKEMEK